ncbi:hypothetical protein [Stigmatella erecta]|uniref:Beta-propeller repeat-containing protein n=1 Tax=Stigmatella erecta TaxID=83460 RepID=A0A1H9ZT25_9BACT|nr:hypothetical protein [Stigmatella erecta]SES84859.1 hypothetical protein SAMN05443639_101420 [Stigmatella erecta]
MKTGQGRRWEQGGGLVGRGWKAWGLALMLAACGGNEVSSQEEPPPVESGADTPTPEVPSGVLPMPEPPAAAQPDPAPPANTIPEVTTTWPRHYGGKGVEWLQALASDSAGGFVAGGLFGSVPFPQGTGFALARYSSTGAPVWVRQISTEDVQVSALTVTPEGNILAVGNYRGAPNLGAGTLPFAGSHLGTGAYSGTFAAKFSPNGNIVWSRGFVPTYFDEDLQQLRYWSISAESVATDANGSLIVAGNFHGEVNFGTGTLYAGDASTYGEDPYPGGFVAKFTWQGAPVWSRAFEARPSEPSNLVRTVATDGAGNILVGGRAGYGANLGDGPLPYTSAFIAKYTPGGALFWKRLFSNAYGEVTGIRALGVGQVVFTANLGGSFSFAGQGYTGGDPDDQGYPLNRSGYIGALSTQGADQWIRDQGLFTLTGLATGDTGTVTLTGFRPGGPSAHLLVRYNTSGSLLWTQSIDGNFGKHSSPRKLFLVPQPGGSVVAGTDFEGTVQYDGKAYTSRGASDLFYFQVSP